MALDHVLGSLDRPREGVSWKGNLTSGVASSGLPAWQSSGGAGKLHPHRALPSKLQVLLPVREGILESVSLIGIFALHGSPEHEPMGAVGALAQLLNRDGDPVFSHSIIQGRHYRDALNGAIIDRPNGDGTKVSTVGSVEIDGEKYAVDQLEIDLNPLLGATCFQFRDMGTPASFMIFDVIFTFAKAAVCPFRGHGEKVSLGEVGSIIRLRDRVRFAEALDQTRQGILEVGAVLDEARGLSLTFLAVVAAALLEAGTSQKLHQLQLETARKLEQCKNATEIAELTLETAESIVWPIMPSASSSSDSIVDKSLRYLDRHYGRAISDEDVADKIGVSTSHFRHLFRQRMGTPFHKYLVRLRLEKARELMAMGQIPVSDVAKACGFVSPAHFSRAFRSEFGLAPSQLKGQGTISD